MSTEITCGGRATAILGGIHDGATSASAAIDGGGEVLRFGLASGVPPDEV